jgi:hypothetical protein
MRVLGNNLGSPIIKTGHKIPFVWVLLCLGCVGATLGLASDNGDGTFTNPVLNADYPDCDVIRVADDYWFGEHKLDGLGRSVPTANLSVEFEITGAGSIIGIGNGDPNSHEPEKGNKRSLYNGLAQIIIQSQRGGSGNLTLTASAKGLDSGTTTISIQATPPGPSVPVP